MLRVGPAVGLTGRPGLLAGSDALSNGKSAGTDDGQSNGIYTTDHRGSSSEDDTTIHLAATHHSHQAAAAVNRLPNRRRQYPASAHSDPLSVDDPSLHADSSFQLTRDEQAHSNGSVQPSADGAPGKDASSSSGHQCGHAEDRVIELRQRWDELLAEAASSTEHKRQHELLPLVSRFAALLSFASAVLRAGLTCRLNGSSIMCKHAGPWRATWLCLS